MKNVIEESIVQDLKIVPSSKASKEAKSLGLKYMGFGRYANSKGQITHIVQNDKLIPFYKREIEKSYKLINNQQSRLNRTKNSEKRENTEKEIKNTLDYLNTQSKFDKESTEELQTWLKEKREMAEKYSDALSNVYGPESIDEEQYNSLTVWKNGGYSDINQFLHNGLTFDDIDGGQSYENVGEWYNHIKKIDEALNNNKLPFDITVYVGLDSELYNSEKLKKNSKHMFKGYISTSLDFEMCLSLAKKSKSAPIILEIDIPKGTNALYLENLIETEDLETDFEVLLQRNTKVKIKSGPHITKLSNISKEYIESANEKLDVHIYKCEVIKLDK